jgi:hypothetical protein
MALSVKVDEQIKYAMNEVKTYPRGYEFEITDILSVNRCVRATNWISFKLKLQTELMKECNAIGYGKFRKR